ncbi:MAG: T9SS type A sorting domain-containing protein [Ignavibacteriae bacterium]|nr:T9SS type A sorting domain-containing protein [Ignavibacteriota bacterium]
MIRRLLFTVMLCVTSTFSFHKLSAQTPVTITAKNAGFYMPGDNPTWRFIQLSSFQPPERGENKVWDYSGVVNGTNVFSYSFLTPDNSEVPNATTVRNSMYALNAFTLTGQSYREVRSNGEFYVANSYDGGRFDLDLTSYIEIPNQTQLIDPVKGNGLTELLLPASYGSHWDTEAKLRINTLVTVPAAGLNQTPLTYLTTRIEVDSIVGWGTLKLPGGVTLDVLLKYNVRITIDSFYIGDQPAPDILLFAFGVEQGAQELKRKYSFHAPGIADDILFYSEFPSGTSAGYRNDLSTSSVHPPTTSESLSVNLFPNPITSGRSILEFEKSSDAPWELELCNMLGEVVQRVPIDNSAGDVRTQLNLPPSIPEGIYYYVIRDEAGKSKGSGKFILTNE